jgi:hypothetical protein
MKLQVVYEMLYKPAVTKYSDRVKIWCFIRSTNLTQNLHVYISENFNLT